MKKNEKAIIAGAGAMLAYFFLKQKEEKKMNISDVYIFPTEFYV